MKANTEAYKPGEIQHQIGPEIRLHKDEREPETKFHFLTRKQ